MRTREKWAGKGRRAKGDLGEAQVILARQRKFGRGKDDRGEGDQSENDRSEDVERAGRIC